MLIQFSHQPQKIIIRSDFIENFFATFFALMHKHITLIFPIIRTNRAHNSTTIRCAVTRKFRIQMQRTKTKRAMIARRARRMFCNTFSTILTHKIFVAHDKGHIFKKIFDIIKILQDLSNFLKNCAIFCKKECFVLQCTHD